MSSKQILLIIGLLSLITPSAWGLNFDQELAKREAQYEELKKKISNDTPEKRMSVEPDKGLKINVIQISQNQMGQK